MSQALSNLAVGSKVKFGSYSVNGEAAQPIVWTIVAKNHTGYPSNSVTLHTSEIIDLRCFDAKEPNNSDSNRQNYGNNRYSVSNIDQWLNKDAAGGAWYSAAHNADHSPDTTAGTGNYNTQYANRPGFLNGFTDDEKAAILSTTIRVVKPNADGGSYEDVVRKVFLPSSTEVGLSNEHDIAEGAAWGYYTSDTARIGYVTQQCFNNTPSITKPSSKTEAWYWWLRTPYYLYSFVIWAINADGKRNGFSPIDGYYGVRPALNLSNTLKVSDTTDSDGCYTFTWPSHPMPWVGGTETYMENETRNVEVSMESKSDVLTPDRQDELWDCKDYYENDSTGYNDYMNFYNGSAIGMFYSGRCHRSERIGTVITTKITFLKAISNIKISRIKWENDVEYYKNDTTLETDTIKLNDAEVYTITATKEQYGSDRHSVIIANDITIGNVSVGDVLSFETKKEGTLDSTSAYKDLVGGLKFYFSSDPITLTETVQVQKTRGINKPVSSIYAGVTATVPVYTETTTTEDIALSTNTFTDFFSASNTGTTGTNAKGITWTDNSSGGLKLIFGNYGINSSTSMTTFTAQRDLTNVVIKGLYYTESNFDKITLTVAGSTVLNAVSGTSSTLTQRWAGSLSKGQTIVLKYVKDSSASASNESSTYFTLSCNPYQKTTTTQTQTGTETKLVDKKIIKGYVGGPDGKARLFFGGGEFSYTGEYTEQDYISSSGTKHKLYTLTTSGEIKLTQEAGYWMCGGGSGGGADSNDKRSGGGGGYVLSGILTKGTYTTSIGSGGAPGSYGSATSFSGAKNVVANGAKGKNGASGGGGGGTGAGISTYPFGLIGLKAHSAGGGGGARMTRGTDNKYYRGADGGSNGANGKEHPTSYSTGSKYGLGGAGGEYGGGHGAKWDGSGSTPATFYGGGGGGASSSYGGSKDGYQGVVYIAIPPITTT